MRPKVPLRQALADPALLGTVLPGETWAAWRTLLIAAMDEPLTDNDPGPVHPASGQRLAA